MMANSKMILAMKISSPLTFKKALAEQAVNPPQDCYLCLCSDAGKKAA